MRSVNSRSIALVGTAAATALVYAAQPATASDHHPGSALAVAKTVAYGFVMPLQFAVEDGKIFVADCSR
ncbi:MAG: hypothetical protein QOE89_1773 [Pseudonocardiales bacterium]|nr:hypothetical protein [Pseudonocardiales bacterium]